MSEILKLKPIRESLFSYDEIEKKIKELFKKYFYAPMLETLYNQQAILNSFENYLKQSILSGKIYYSKDRFFGHFNSTLSRKLIEYGAVWDDKSHSFIIKLNELPFSLRGMISLAKAKYDQKLNELDKKLAQFNTESMSKELNVYKYFDKTLWEINDSIEDSVKNISVIPTLTEQQSEIISKEWERNTQLDIKKFVDEQIFELRQTVKDNVLVEGNRRETLVKQFVDSYHVSESKAKFWARQETNLLAAKFKEVRYTQAGVNEYEWRCVHMPKQPTPNIPYRAGEVRYSHGILEGKTFSWDNPPITTPPGQQIRRNNPGQDYNCRCFALPIVRFNKGR